MIQKNKKFDNFIWYLVLIACIVLIVGTLYQVWTIVTYEASVEMDCSVQQIDYIELKGNGSCVFPLVQGDVSLCGLPRDVHCKFAGANVPIAKIGSILRSD